MVVNGEKMELAQSGLSSLMELVHHYDLDPRAVAVEMNGEIPNREEWERIQLADTDRIELIRFVGGG